MKNKYFRFYLFLIFFLFFKDLLINKAIAQEIKFNSKEISVDATNETIIGSGAAEATIEYQLKFMQTNLFTKKKKRNF